MSKGKKAGTGGRGINVQVDAKEAVGIIAALVAWWRTWRKKDPPPPPPTTAALAILLVLCLTACQGVVIPPCILDASCPAGHACIQTPNGAWGCWPVQSPAPSPVPTPTPIPSPVTTPTPPPAAGCAQPTAVHLVEQFDPPQGRDLQGAARRFIVRLTADQPEACRIAQDKRGEVPHWWYAAYPGTSCTFGSFDDKDQCGIEHPTRACDADEKAEDAARGLDPRACGRPDSFAGADKVGVGGGPPGIIRVCAAPRRARIGEADCRSWFRDLDGARPASSTPLPPPACAATVPTDPVPVVYPEDFACRDAGLVYVQGASGPNGEKFCVAISACQDADQHCQTPAFGITPEMLDGATDCKAWPWSIAYHMGRNDGTYEIVGGYLLDRGRGLIDAYGRNYREDVAPPTRNSLKSLWQVWGRCPPQAAMPCAPSSPPPAPPPTSPPLGAGGPPFAGEPPGCARPCALCPCNGFSPSGWVHAPVRVGLGEKPMGHTSSFANGEAVSTRWNLNTTPRDVPPYVPHRGNQGEAEQWAPSAEAWAAANGPPPMWCEGPAGRFEPGVDGSPYNRYIRIGEGGHGPPGHYICGVRPHGARQGENETVREFDLDVRP